MPSGVTRFFWGKLLAWKTETKNFLDKGHGSSFRILPSKHEALSSNLSTKKKKKKERKETSETMQRWQMIQGLEDLKQNDNNLR
jgi:hypothetical protein